MMFDIVCQNLYKTLCLPSRIPNPTFPPSLSRSATLSAAPSERSVTGGASVAGLGGKKRWMFREAMEKPKEVRPNIGLMKEMWLLQFWKTCCNWGKTWNWWSRRDLNRTNYQGLRCQLVNKLVWIPFCSKICKEPCGGHFSSGLLLLQALQHLQWYGFSRSKTPGLRRTEGQMQKKNWQNKNKSSKYLKRTNGLATKARK